MKVISDALKQEAFVTLSLSKGAPEGSKGDTEITVMLGPAFGGQASSA
jgi:hypothetical protein